jgi:hypothetical protein
MDLRLLVIGGVNGAVGFVLELFRGTNRYSIMIMLLILLFLVRELTQLTRHLRRRTRFALAAAWRRSGCLIKCRVRRLRKL